MSGRFPYLKGDKTGLVLRMIPCMPCIRMRRESRWVILACICEALGWQRFWDYACIRMRRKSRCVTHAYISAALGWQGLVFGATSHPKDNLILSTGLKMFVFERLSLTLPFYLRHFVFSSSLSFFWFLRWTKGGGLRGIRAGWENDFSMLLHDDRQLRYLLPRNLKNPHLFYSYGMGPPSGPIP